MNKLPRPIMVTSVICQRPLVPVASERRWVCWRWKLRRKRSEMDQAALSGSPAFMTGEGQRQRDLGSL